MPWSWSSTKRLSRPKISWSRPAFSRASVKRSAMRLWSTWPPRRPVVVVVASVPRPQRGLVVVGRCPPAAHPAGVVDLAPGLDPLLAVLEGLVELGADDGRDALGLAGLVERQGAVHVAVVGHAEGR